MRDCVDIIGVPVDRLNMAEILTQLERFIDERRQSHYVLAVNAHILNLAQENAQLKHILNIADLVYPDGMSLIWVSYLLGKKLPEKSTTTDLFPKLCSMAARKGYRIFLLGARPGIAEDVAKKITKEFKNLQVVGAYHGYFSTDQRQTLIDQINSTQPNIVLVAMGSPQQEKWIYENSSYLNADVFINCGNLFDFVIGRVNRGPKWMTDNGFEWLARLVVEPRRLWKRYIIGNPLFLYRVLKQRFRSER